MPLAPNQTPCASASSGYRHFALALSLLTSLSVTYRLYLFNSVALGDTTGYNALIAGTGPAPEQYRIGVVETAYWMTTHFHIRMSRAFGVLDLISSTLAVLLLYRVFELTSTFRHARPHLRWAGSLAFAAAMLFYFNWVIWYQKVETLPTTAMVALLLWIWTPGRGASLSRKSQWLTVLAILITVTAQAFVRADVVLFISAGVFLGSLTPAGRGFSLSQRITRVVSLLSMVVSAGIQLYLMKIAYPHATYDGVPVVMILHDYKEPMLWFAFFIFIAPFLWTVHRVIRDRFTTDSPSVAFMIGALGYIVIWVVLGRLDEVRIFIPLGMSLAPLFAELLMLRIQPQLESSLAAGSEAQPNLV